jgi:hypothetical protein
VRRWLLISAALGLIASGISYAILSIATDTVGQLQIRMMAGLIWPTGLFLLANEGATTSLEVATNFAKAIGGNVLLYSAVGALLYGLKRFARRALVRKEA